MIPLGLPAYCHILLFALGETASPLLTSSSTGSVSEHFSDCCSSAQQHFVIDDIACCIESLASIETAGHPCCLQFCRTLDSLLCGYCPFLPVYFANHTVKGALVRMSYQSIHYHHSCIGGNASCILYVTCGGMQLASCLGGTCILHGGNCILHGGSTDWGDLHLAWGEYRLYLALGGVHLATRKWMEGMHLGSGGCILHH